MWKYFKNGLEPSAEGLKDFFLSKFKNKGDQFSSQK